MVQKYQNEISPIFYYGISRKTCEKDLKIPTLQLKDWKSPYWMTLYVNAMLWHWGKKIYSQLLRNIYISEKFPDCENVGEQRELVALMGTSLNSAQSFYNKFIKNEKCVV